MRWAAHGISKASSFPSAAAPPSPSHTAVVDTGPVIWTRSEGLGVSQSARARLMQTIRYVTSTADDGVEEEERGLDGGGVGLGDGV